MVWSNEPDGETTKSVEKKAQMITQVYIFLKNMPGLQLGLYFISIFQPNHNFFYVVGIQKNHLSETIHLSTQNTC